MTVAVAPKASSARTIALPAGAREAQLGGPLKSLLLIGLLEGS
jgi:hypothetical protein